MPETRPMVPLAPDQVISVLGRAGYGARPEEIGPVARGFPAWLEEQLAPREDQDQITQLLHNSALFSTVTSLGAVEHE